MNDEDLILKDWEMTKDRIKHFDDVIIRLRIQGIPIAAAIQAAGFASINYTKNVFFLGCSLTSLILIFGSLYLLPILGLDLFHFRLLMISVNHAISIEQLPQFKNKLQITSKLTSPKLTKLHTILAAVLYSSLISFGIIAGCVIK
jgi:hypothetical protein